MTGRGGHESALPVRVVDGCVIVRVRLTPKSSLDAVGETTPTADGPALHIKVRAVPTKGEANAAAERVLARWLDVPAGRVRLVAGGKARIKSLAVEGDVAHVTAQVAERLKAGNGR